MDKLAARSLVEVAKDSPLFVIRPVDQMPFALRPI